MQSIFISTNHLLNAEDWGYSLAPVLSKVTKLLNNIKQHILSLKKSWNKVGFRQMEREWSKACFYLGENSWVNMWKSLKMIMEVWHKFWEEGRTGKRVRIRGSALHKVRDEVIFKPLETCTGLLGSQWEAVRFNIAHKGSAVQKNFLQWWKRFTSALSRIQSAESDGSPENLPLH